MIISEQTNKMYENILKVSCVCVLPLRCGGPRPICWVRPKGSWGFGFIALVCRAESELVLSGRKRRIMKSNTGGQTGQSVWRLWVNHRISCSASTQAAVVCRLTMTLYTHSHKHTRTQQLATGKQFHLIYQTVYPSLHWWRYHWCKGVFSS